MKTFVNISFPNNAINVEGQEIIFKDKINILPIHKNIANIYWNNGYGELEGNQDHPIGENDFQFAENEYEKHIVPYVLQWEIEFDRQNAENIAMLAKEEAYYNSPESIAERLRQKRDEILNQTDHFMIPDYPIDDTNKKEIIAYRQALRDLPEQEGWPLNIEWPIEDEGSIIISEKDKNADCFKDFKKKVKKA